jgi:hypothetical protein
MSERVNLRVGGRTYQALAVACPECKASPGYKCVNRKTPHRARDLAFDAQQANGESRGEEHDPQRPSPRRGRYTHHAACDSDVLHTAQQSQRIPLYVATGPRRWAAAWVAGLGSGYPHHREAR